MKRKVNPIIKIGAVYGLWTIIGEPIKKNSVKYYPCECACGSKKVIHGRTLLNGKSKSCGCANKSRFVKKYTDRIHALYERRYGWSIKNKYVGEPENILPFDDWVKLIHSPCEYCGEYGSNVERDTTNGRLTSGTLIFINGIDRKDSTKSYTKENSVSCCKRCNIMKGTFNPEDFLEHIEKIYNKICVQ